MNRIRIFDGSGNYLTDVVTRSVTRAWVLNTSTNGTGIRSGQAQMILSVLEPSCTEKYLRYGNILLVESDTTIPWGGVIDTPRSWGNKAVTVTAYEMTRLLNFRRASSQQVVTGPAGALFTTMLEIANGEADTLIYAGDVYMDGVQRQETINVTKLGDEIQRIVTRSNNELIITPEITELGKIRFRADWLRLAGTDKTTILRDRDLSADTGLQEQGDIVNDVIAYGPGATWDSRTQQRSIYDGSPYGLRQAALSVQGRETSTVQDDADSYLAQHREPRRTYKISVTGSAIADLRLGDTMGLELVSMGFTGGAVGTSTRVRIIAMAYDDERGTMSVTADEVIA